MVDMTVKLYTLEQAAEYLQVHTRTIKRWYAQGKIDLIELPGGTYRVSEAELLRLTTPQETSEAG